MFYMSTGGVWTSVLGFSAERLGVAKQKKIALQKKILLHLEGGPVKPSKQALAGLSTAAKLNRAGKIISYVPRRANRSTTANHGPTSLKGWLGVGEPRPPSPPLYETLSLEGIMLNFIDHCLVSCMQEFLDRFEVRKYIPGDVRTSMQFCGCIADCAWSTNFFNGVP